MSDTGRISREKETVARMIGLYCRLRHDSEQDMLCTECTSLLAYAYARIDRCPQGEDKCACSRCPVHCYQKQRREQIRQVMRFSGPRMVWYYPGAFFRHLLGK